MPIYSKAAKVDSKGIPNRLTLSVLICIILVIGLFHVSEVLYKDKSSSRISQLFNQPWLSRCHRPHRISLDNCFEFKKRFILLIKDFCFESKPTLIMNPKLNAILEMVHQEVGDILCLHDLNNHNFDELDPSGSILQQITWAICSTHHTTNKASPIQLVFGGDMLFNMTYITG